MFIQSNGRAHAAVERRRETSQSARDDTCTELPPRSWGMVCSRHIATDEIADRLTVFPKHSHWSRFLQLEGGLHSGIAASLCVNLQALTDGVAGNDLRTSHPGSARVNVLI